MRTTISAAALLAASLALPLSPSAGAEEGPTCRGRAATHVGVPGEALRTTPGRDVVVTNGADRVNTLNGDDLICATRDPFVSIVPGGGDDLVDATGFTGEELETVLGNAGVDGSSGDDRYVGGDQLDRIHVWSGTGTDHKTIHTDGGEDYLVVGAGYPGDVTAELGRGRDDYVNQRPRPGVVVDGEQGRNGFVTECLGCATFEAYLTTGRVVVHGDPAGRAVGFADFELVDSDHQVVEWAYVVATDGRNEVVMTSCTGVVRAREGDDRLSGGVDVLDDCDVDPGSDDGIGVALFGAGGDDVLGGAAGDDILRGGVGVDEATGAGGSDVCRAEVEVDCES